MKNFRTKTVAVFAIAALILTFAPSAVFAQNSEAATRGEVVGMLLTAADDYNPGVVKSDVIKGYGDGDLREDKAVSRAEALIMLKRAFGELPKPVGHNARVASPPMNLPTFPNGRCRSLKMFSIRG